MRKFGRTGSWVLALTASALLAETPPAMEYKGKPLGVAITCTPEDVTELGLSCSPDDPCPVFLELSSLAVLGNRLLVAGNLHTANATLTAVLLASEDGGHTWTEPLARIKYATLDQMQFIDFGTGWISGQHLFPTPHDPFFLLSSDGGKTWRNRPILDDAGPGAIDQYFFSSRTDGMMLVDRRPGAEGGRYALYETKTGGESWSLRQLNETPLKLKQSIPPPAGWRLRTDNRIKAYVVETNGGQGWTAAASFLVRPGDCKGVEPAPAPTPAPAASEEKPHE